ncbi:hypothetical protein H0H93_006063 [Arthromyces matolae]|nr:hypothetical protein H0H93_006063 [Arthromyces matolae]
MAPKGGNAKKESGRAKKAENEANKKTQAANEKEKKEAEKWSEGSKADKASKLDKEEKRKADLARKAENARLLAEEEASAPAKVKAAPKAGSGKSKPVSKPAGPGAIAAGGGLGLGSEPAKDAFADKEIESFAATGIDNALDLLEVVNAKMDKASIGQQAAGIERHPERPATEPRCVTFPPFHEHNGQQSWKMESGHILLVTGHTGGFNQESRDRDLPFVHKDEPATVPRVKQIVLITEHSPWCTIVTNETGVTLNDICVQVYKDYTTQITGAEYTSLQPRVQEQVKRISAHNQMSLSGWNNGGFYPGTPMATVNPDQLKRCDWLRERIYFEGLRKDDTYARARLGYHASNIFLMDLAG